MPMLGKKTFHLVKSLNDVQPGEKIYTVLHTQEQFRSKEYPFVTFHLPHPRWRRTCEIMCGIFILLLLASFHSNVLEIVFYGSLFAFDSCASCVFAEQYSFESLILTVECILQRQNFVYIAMVTTWTYGEMTFVFVHEI